VNGYDIGFSGNGPETFANGILSLLSSVHNSPDLRESRRERSNLIQVSTRTHNDDSVDVLTAIEDFEGVAENGPIAKIQKLLGFVRFHTPAQTAGKDYRVGHRFSRRHAITPNSVSRFTWISLYLVTFWSTN
jgi:hypothetical protein